MERLEIYTFVGLQIFLDSKYHFEKMRCHFNVNVKRVTFLKVSQCHFKELKVSYFLSNELEVSYLFPICSSRRLGANLSLVSQFLLGGILCQSDAGARCLHPCGILGRLLTLLVWPCLPDLCTTQGQDAVRNQSGSWVKVVKR